MQIKTESESEILSKKNILVVEDEGIIAMDIRERLVSLGYNALDSVSSGEEAIKQVKLKQPDLVLMDIILDGEMDGIEAAQHIRDQFNIPVAFISAYADEKILEKAKAAEPFGYILKPFDDRDLRVAIEVALFKHELEVKVKDREKLVEKEKQDLETRRREFLESVAHELRSPLTTIKGFSELLLKSQDKLSQAQQQRCSELLFNNISKLEKLIIDISELSRIERGVFELSKSKIELTEFLSNNSASYKLLLKDSFEFISDISTKVLVDLDEDRFHQVLSNLIDNAIKNTPVEERKIIMEVKKLKKRKMIQIKISDNGAGIESKNLKLIFEPFVTLQTKYSSKGTGIGLSLCKNILKRHDGSITAESKGLGKGSTFTIELPIRRN